MNFKDHFSLHARDYLRYRPRYPKDLFAYLASLCPEHHTCWDCATGNGQAALSLTNHFDLVIATDASAEQIAHAFDHPQIDYRNVPAEHSEIWEHTIDLVTVAQALHWFNFEQFYTEVRRVLKPGGIIAAWTYSLLNISPEIDEIANHFYEYVVGEFWPPERSYVEKKYKSLPFSFNEIDPPEFSMTRDLDLPELLGYINTWSATQRFIRTNGKNPLKALEKNLLPLWGNPDEKKHVVWPLYLRVGRI